MVVLIKKIRSKELNSPNFLKRSNLLLKSFLDHHKGFIVQNN